jgi:hypothetical protein
MDFELKVIIVIAATLLTLFISICIVSYIGNEQAARLNIKMIETVKASCLPERLVIECDGYKNEIKKLECR